ncbi:MAG: hypothetical protein NWQ26_05810 [Paraglaciecola sp.]|nr:hypothetical protein [Paraglaciecola sp.]
MAQATIGFSKPTRTTGFLSLGAMGEWLVEHIEIVVFILCICAYQYYEYQREQNATAIVQHPQQYDFMFVDYFVLDKTSDARHRYVPLKVMAVDEQNVTFKIGNIAHSTPVSPRQHMKFDSAMHRNFYRAYTLSLSKDKITNSIL